MKILLGIIIPLVGTTLGSSLVFLLKNEKTSRCKKILIGFSSGVMLAASIWSLLIPSIDLAKKEGMISFLPACIGFIIGIIIFILIDVFLSYINKNNKHLSNNNKLILAVTLHNIPEGMAIGAIYAGIMLGKSDITIASALTLSIGIALQNLPEGAIISMPLYNGGTTKLKSFFYGFLSGLVEPIGAIITILLTKIIMKILPFLLSFASAAMIYVVVEELIPEYHDEKNKIGTLSFAIGFIIMMLLDIVLG